jgi:hypothetical protein
MSRERRVNGEDLDLNTKSELYKIVEPNRIKSGRKAEVSVRPTWTGELTIAKMCGQGVGVLFCVAFGAAPTVC